MCYTPITIRQNTADAMTVGCGRCEACHLKYCNQWAFRIQQHAQENPIYYCITLTYDNENLPMVYNEGKTYMTLVRAHASNYFKTLRNNHNKRWKQHNVKPKISYIICGEYGDKFKRPHYHAIVFGASAEDILISWTKGLIHFGQNNLKETLVYTLKYAMKSKLYRNMGSPPFERPFINFSKGIGLNAIVDFKTGEQKMLPEEIVTTDAKILIPRYYADKLNMSIDTEKYRLRALEKHRGMIEHLNKNGITLDKWRKMYHRYLWKTKKAEMYDNEILTEDFDKLLDRVKAKQ